VRIVVVVVRRCRRVVRGRRTWSVTLGFPVGVFVVLVAGVAESDGWVA